MFKDRINFLSNKRFFFVDIFGEYKYLKYLPTVYNLFKCYNEIVNVLRQIILLDNVLYLN